MFNAFKRFVVRYSERSATSVPPKSKATRLLDDMDLGLVRAAGGASMSSQDQFKEVLKKHAARAAAPVDLPPFLDGQQFSAKHVGVIDTRGKSNEEVRDEIANTLRALMEQPVFPDPEVGNESPTPPRQGPVNRATGEIRPHPDDLSWGDVLEMRSRSIIPGWSFCRFPIRTRIDDVGTEKVFWGFGVVKDHFGALWEPFWHCHDGSERPLAVLFHLPSGNALGLMMNLALACEAGDAMLKLDGIDWRSIDPNRPESFERYRTRISDLWANLGLAPMPYHVHAMQGGEITGEVHQVLGRTVESITPKGTLS